MDDSDEMSAAGEGHEFESASKSVTHEKLDVNDLLNELRHKFITILKSLYWEYFEHG